MIARAFAVVSGALILAAVAHVTVISTGGYGTPHSYVTIAIAIGAAGSGVFSGMAWASRRVTLAICLACCIVAGEAYQFLATADRLITSLEAVQAPLRAENNVRARAERRVRDAQAAIANVPTTSSRLQKAEAAKTAADLAVVQKSSERGCLVNCRQLLQAQVDAAALEVQNARIELADLKDKADTELTAAVRALDGIRQPASATPFADRIGAPAWALDLVRSALGSIAANGLGICLMIFGAHHTTPHVEVIAPAEKRRPQHSEAAFVVADYDVNQHAARFAIECLQPGGEADLQAIRSRYGAWCPPERRFSEAQIGQALATLFGDAGIGIAERDGRLVAIGVSLKRATDAKALGRMTPRRMEQAT
jgi:hypothetical protein